MLFLLDSPDVDFNTFFNPHSIIVKLNAFSLSAQTAYSMVRKANLNKGDNVLVTAATSNTSLSVIERLK